VIAMLGTLKAGAAYVPIDPNNPSERIAYMAGDACVGMLLTHASILSELTFDGLHVQAMDDVVFHLQLGSYADTELTVESSPWDLANIIYTSGSTGRPKGVLVTHIGVTRLLVNPGFIELNRDTVMLQICSCSFDMSTFEIWGALLNGGTLVLYPSRYVDNVSINEQIIEHDINTIVFPTSLFDPWSFEAQPQSTIKWIVVAGDILNPHAVNRVYGADDRLTIVNGYGPTENTMLTTYYVVPREFSLDRSLPIGASVNGTFNYVLSPAMQQMPPGAVGELYTGGIGVARGYINQAALTSEKFVVNPFGAEPSVLYKTGDLVRYLPDGNLEYLGRRDNQVKIRGYRIELGDVVAALNLQAGVVESIAIVYGQHSGKRIVGYLVAPDVADEAAFLATVKAGMRQLVPEYMVPEILIRLQRLPLSPNGKVDKRALPDPGEHADTSSYVAPSSLLEQQIAEVWIEVLGREQVSAHANFFEIGGHSLRAVQVVTRLRQLFGVDVGVRTLFEQPTVASLASAIVSAKKTGPSNIARAPRDRPLPLSWAQQRLWFLDRLDKSAGYAYRIPVGLRLRGKLDRAALRAALDRIVQRHESLRTSFPLLDGQPVQAVASPEIGFALLEHDLSDLPSSSQEAAILEYGAAETRRPFDLAHGPVARGQLLRLADHDHILHVTQHHIVSDAWSLGVLVREVVALYSAFAAKQPDPLPPLSIQYGDYAAWQREWLSGDALDKQIEFWRQHLGGAPALLELPTDRPRPPVQSFAGGTYSFMLPADLVQGLHELSQRHETTLFMTLLSAWAVLLGRLSGQSDVVIGTPVANRQHVDVEPLIGFFVNTLALRVRLEDGSDTAALLARVKQDFLEAYNYQDVPFEQIVEALQPQRNLSHSPVFQVMLSLDNTPRQQALALPDMVVEPVAAATATAHFDLSLSLSGSGDALAANLDYASDLFDAGTIERWAGHFQMLLRAMVRDDHCQIAAMPLIDESESRQLLAFSQGAIGGTRDVYLHQLFEEQVHLRANALALVGEEGQLSYTALNERANRIAHYLLAQGLRTGDRVAVCLRGSLDLVAALLGVLKAGAVYVPLDPIYPRDRLTNMLQDSGAAFLLAHAAGLDGFSALASTVSILALDTAELASLPAHNPEPMAPGLTHDHVAYIIYTSGSTGTPKAVMNHHAGVSNFAQVSVEAFGVVHDSQVLQAASCAFDASLLEINMALCAGATLHMAPRESLLPGAPLLETMRSHRITHAFLTPSALAALPVDAELPALHTIVVGGEAIQAGLATQWLRRCRLINAYGPTEAAIASTLFDCSLPWQGNVPIGRPIANARVHILDSQMQPVPVGMAGELYIGGIGVAHGYLHRDNLTRERFVADPFDIDVDAHLYRTGDVGRWRPDGFIEYLGRNDFQVKIRGFRIEAGEIEVLLATVPGVRQAVVAAREDRPGDKRLVAYIVLTDEAHFEVGELRTRLAHDLPEYMIPSAFVRMDGLPLSASGKIDLRALPAPDADAVARQEYEAPVGEVECCIADIWTELLGASPISRHDQFFELGGHSLLAVHFVSRLRDRLGVDLPLRMLFQQPTLATLAASVSKSTASAALVPDSRIPAGCAVITPDMLTLATLEQDEINQIVAGVPGGAACIQDIYPLSPLQKGILFHHLLDETDDPYLLRTVLLIRDEAHLRAILSALQQVIARHDILRSSFHWDGLRDPMQVVHRQASLRVTKLQAATSEIAMDRLREVTEAHDLSMDLRQSPLIVAYTLEMADSGEHLLGIVNHHLIADHVALQLVMGEVALLLEGKGELLPEPVPYKNFIYQASAVSEAEHQAYFSRLLADVEDTTAPFGVLDGHRSEVMRQLGVALDPELSSRVRQCVRQLGVGAAVLLHAAWSLVVAKCVGRDDIVFGTVLLGRLGGIQNAERVVGMFINTLPVRVRIGHANARELVFALQKQLSELLEHEQASLALAQRCSTLPASTPLFTTLFNYRHSSHGQTNVEEVIRGHRVVELKERTNYPIELDVDDYGTAFGITLKCIAQLDPSRLTAYFETALAGLLNALEQDAQARVMEIDVLPVSERDELLEKFNATTEEFPRDLLIHQLFEARATQQPEAIAVIAEDECLSYAELNQQANRLAHRLRSLGVKPDVPVALCMERSLDMVVCILAVNKAGGAYVPIDPEYPRERIAYMLSNANARLLLKQTHLLQGISFEDVTVVDIDGADTRQQLEGCDDGNIDPRKIGLEASHLCYVIYTSGSTGRPKGVMIEHEALLNRIHWMQKRYRLTIEDCVLQKTPYSFDVSVWEFWWTLTEGAKLVMAKPGGHRDPAYLQAIIQVHDVTTLHFVPSMLASMLTHARWDACTSVRQVFCSGEALPRNLVADFWASGTQSELHNLYGPTEAAIDVTSWDCRGYDDAEVIPIGKPIDNIQIYMLDALGQPVPKGVAGELHIAGVGLARGYIGNAGLTDEKFVTVSLRNGDALIRLYKTGGPGPLERAGRYRISRSHRQPGEIERPAHRAW
jgi:amino acid adenylation domain-containing protein